MLRGDLLTSLRSLEASIREDVELIKKDPLFGGKAPATVGLLYDVETGVLKEIDGSQAAL